ncbi:hypothetical protein ACH4HG_41145 [Streptomyces coeruleorubidus]|uniref:hypothetical protein n=1 Tax=Streptomyces coeruleorubidus TaxID=116188 RepID=UPI0037B05645
MLPFLLVLADDPLDGNVGDPVRIAYGRWRLGPGRHRSPRAALDNLLEAVQD